MRSGGRDDRVYFFLPRSLAEGPVVKIGFSSDVGRRFRTHATEMGGVPIASLPGSRRLEAAWHRRFEHLRLSSSGARELYWLNAELDFAITQAIAASPHGREEIWFQAAPGCAR